MPKNTPYTLAWSNIRQTYELHEGLEDVETVNLGTQCHTRLVWVAHVSSFAFHGKNGSYTARKERKQRGDEYWYAYVRIVGKLTKKYLGKSCDLTLARLELTAQELWLAPQTPLSLEEIALAQPPSLTTYKEQFFSAHLHEDHPLSSGDVKRSPDRGYQPNLTSGYHNSVVTRKIEQSPATAGVVSEPLLATKLHVPRPRSHQVHRTRLIQRLKQGMERTLTLISAPAGFGKTTLLADWIASDAIPAAWFSLEPQDNDPTRFLSYVIASLQSLNPHLGTTVQALRSPLQPPPMEIILTLLINDLLTAGTIHQEHLVLVLDNYQVITSEAIHHALSFLLSHLPPQMHLVLATREDPPLPLAHLRGRDHLLETRAADLRFTFEETSTYLVDVMGLSLSTQEVALLEERTEGWITGLHLVALSLQGRDDKTDFIASFTGSHHYVADYLLGEVLNRQSKVIQDFLLQTCILERLNPLLCDMVRAQEGSGILLEYLERANLFLVPLDDERHWYRYHHLFAAVLRQRLSQSAPALAADLHLRASQWYEQHGFFAEAVSHALTASAPEDVARLTEYFTTLLAAKNEQCVAITQPPDFHRSSLMEPLTIREHEVLLLLLDGLSNREISNKLTVSVNTAKKHVLNICSKLNVQSRAHAIAKARMLRLLQ